MKAIIIIGLLSVLTTTQTIVTPKTQTCQCINLLNQPDCISFSGCAWNVTQETCANSSATTPLATYAFGASTYCGLVANPSTACAGTLGCAYFNNTCQIFTGCSAYVQTTNSACQAISTQCTTDGTRCVLPGACSTYNTQALCETNIASSGAKQCKWTVSGNSRSCVDKTCVDAPTTFNTLAQCKGWMSNCLSNGRRCVASLELCSTNSDGCIGMIGSDGACTENSAGGSTTCRPLMCSDAPQQKSTNTACNAFLSGCVTTKKGCVSVLDQCNSYSQKLGCIGLVGSDGPCTTDAATGACRALTCTDAPASTIFDKACNIFMEGCQTTGQGCVIARGACSSYQGTKTTCLNLIGTDGNCKGTGTILGACAAKLCTDAPTTLKTNAACNAFQIGCLTTGEGCVSSLGFCSTYKGTVTTCLQYIGLDGNCTAPSSQTSEAACVPKICTDGLSKSNSSCKEFSFQCVSNGTNCVFPGTCETIELPISCEGSSSCNLGSQCLNRSQCSNYTTQSQCLMNQQQYVVSGTTFLRSCIWTHTCLSKLCSDQSKSLTTDSECDTALAGCVTTGAGCIDISAACSAYQGTNLTCLNFKGINKTMVCTQLQSQTTSANCIERICDNATIANGSKVSYSSNSECQVYLSICYWNGNTGCTNGGCSQYFGLQSTCSAITTAGQPCWSLSITSANLACINKICSHADSKLDTDAKCQEFLKGCFTNGAGCISPPTQSCSSYKGTQTACQMFTGGTDGICDNVDGAIDTTVCIARTCASNTTSKTNATCNAWKSACVWTGTIGCKDPSTCAQFNGTIDSCPTFSGSDGPCSGTGQTSQACISNSKICIQAPASFTTNAQCQTWHSTCMTNGFGCISKTGATCDMIVSSTVCPLYKSTLGCDIAKDCITKQLTCGGYKTAFQCSNVPISRSIVVTCAWSSVSNSCVNLTCSLLPITLKTDSACSAVISSCTTNGAGCVTKGACSTYNKVACGNAVATDSQKRCIWQNSFCRPITCSDFNTGASDAECNTFLTGCRTTGYGCSNLFRCSQITQARLCLKDYYDNPCLWYKGICINYAECKDVVETTHANCQLVSPLCTTNGITCVAISGCRVTSIQASCILGTDGKCGWLPASGSSVAQCQIFTNCTSANGVTTLQCQLWGSTCVSNGKLCISKTTCSSYDTQIGCGNDGTDGPCFYEKGFCRQQLCEDAPAAAVSVSTHSGCVSFQATCTTSGKRCIPQSNCHSYTVQAGCVQGTDGECFWAQTTTLSTTTTPSTTSSVCRLKQCKDSIFTTNQSCGTASRGVKCVSNGVNCIPQSTCQSYTSEVACLGGGSDGQCAYNGTCTQFTSCNSANSNVLTCNSRSDACYFDSKKSLCIPHTCLTRALGSTCQPVPSFDYTTYTICVLTGSNCSEGSPKSLTSFQCFDKSVRTYTWNPQKSDCQSCQIQANNSTSEQNNTTQNQTTYGYVISLLIKLIFIEGI